VMNSSILFSLNLFAFDTIRRTKTLRERGFVPLKRELSLLVADMVSSWLFGN
jgi:hypothetical protein